MQPFNIQQQLENLKVSLQQYGIEIGLYNADNRNDEAKRAETLYQGVLSRLYSCCLSNLNYAITDDGKKNTFTAGIDLLDDHAGIAVQITSVQNHRPQKVHDALTKTAERKNQKVPFYANISRLTVLFIAHDHLEPVVVRPSDMQLAAESGITLNAVTISSLLDDVANQYALDSRAFYNLQSAITFTNEFLYPGYGQPPIHSAAHHEKLALGKNFQIAVSDLALSKAYRLRGLEHFNVWNARQPLLYGHGWPVFIPEDYYAGIGAEALLSQNSLVRFWSIDNVFLNNVARFLRDWPTAPSSNIPLFCEIPDLCLIESDIYLLCERIMYERNRLDAFGLPRTYNNGPALCVRMRPSELAPLEGRMRPENQAYGFDVDHPDWFMNKTDGNAEHIARSSGLEQQYSQWLQTARELDALIESLCARGVDHRALIAFHSGQGESRRHGMNYPYHY